MHISTMSYSTLVIVVIVRLLLLQVSYFFMFYGGGGVWRISKYFTYDVMISITDKTTLDLIVYLIQIYLN